MWRPFATDRRLPLPDLVDRSWLMETGLVAVEGAAAALLGGGTMGLRRENAFLGAAAARAFLASDFLDARAFRSGGRSLF